MNRYPLLSSRNIFAYATVMILWAVVSVALGMIFRNVAGSAVQCPWPVIIAAVGVMSGMMIMFGASALNLRKLRHGFERLAKGDADPGIPAVWCPVLTMATRAASELSENLHESHRNNRNS